MSMSATSLPARKPPLPTPQSGESLRRGERRWVVVSGRCALSGALSASWVRVRARARWANPRVRRANPSIRRLGLGG